ncbi:Cytoplasmic dynein 2 heavy chain 1 [Varanus komodoensis]|nr:Cytoplasmic dynein 2 heavy chain 1 [Varanus komodoensis]
MNAAPKEWVIIGQVDMEALVEKNLFNEHDWEKNFKTLKGKGKEVERLPSTVKVDCITVNCNPVKSVIDDLIQKLYDVLVMSLRKSIQAHVHDISSFLNDAMKTLVARPQTVDEITEDNLKYKNLKEKKEEIFLLFQEAEGKNKLLRTVAGSGIETIGNLRATWDKFELMIESHQLMIKEQIEVMKDNLMSRVNIYFQELEKFKARWDQLKPSNDIIETGHHDLLQKSAEMIKEKKTEFDELEDTKQKLSNDCSHFELEVPDFSLADEVHRDIECCAEVWALYEQFYEGFQEKANEDWITFRSKTYLFEEFLLNWHEKLRKIEEHTIMTVKLQKEVDKYKMTLPILKYVRGEHLSPDHWLDLFRILGLPRGTSLENLLFGDLLKVADVIVERAAELKDLNSRAHGEVTIREALRELELWGVGAVFTLTDYEDSQGRMIKLIKDWKDIVNQVGDNRCLLQSLKDSPYYKGFQDKVSVWEKKLAELDEYLQNLNQIQRKWVYLEPIFGRGALPREQARFNRVDEDFRSILTDIKQDNRITSLNARAGIRNALITILDQLQRCQKSLNEFLEEKRSAFPRFYFIGDDDLLEILGQSTNPQVIQSHLKKLFAGIHSVSFDEDFKNIIAMKSLEGEIVPFKNKILLSNDVEVWLNKLSLEMKETLKQLLIDCVTTGKKSQGSIDPSLFPSQILCLAEQIQFTEDVEYAIKERNLQQLELELMAKLEQYTSIDTNTEDSGNTESGILELKLKALILDVIHNIDIVRQLNEAQIHSTDDWAWKKQLRFYLKDKKCYIQMVDAELQYTYEYQGNSPKLVYTPLTDKCYLTLTQAMKTGLGGNPYGPAGTGKTESVKALGGLLGRQVLVFNCDEGIDVKSMGRIFVGLVKCGAWGCFDEFNRLEEAVLSAVSMQIQTIQHALKKHQPVCELLGKKVEMDHNSGIFITMNPAGKGYGGRQKLPDNLKQLFRPVAMTRPDNELIAEVILYSEGFKDAKPLGRKLVDIFNLARELLTPQQHYDWGLRALKTVLRGCGNLLRQLKKNGMKEKVNESHIVVQALRLNTMSKLTFADCARFDALAKDVFPGIDFKDVDYAELNNALQEVFEEANLEIIPTQVNITYNIANTDYCELIFLYKYRKQNEREQKIKKVLELYEQLRQRMGVVIVGPSGAGKSTLWRMLRAALGKVGKVVKQYTMNPKAMPRRQLLGHIDMDTREWSDGVLTNSARQVVREPPDVTSWIICDGDIDPEWIESLNSVLDDNRLLTMPSGERIQFGPNVNFVFETHDLSCASPATISRMGMIFLSDEDTDLNSLIKSWLRNQPEEYRQNLENWIGDYFEKALNWVVKQNDYVIETSLVGTVMNGLSHLHGCTERGQFIISLIRGLGGNLNMKSRQEFTKEVFTWARVSLPNPNKLLDTYYDPDTECLISYQLKKPEKLTADDFSNIRTLPVIQTPDMQRGLDYFKPWLGFDTKQPFLLVGPEGCGKGMLLRYAFSQLRSTQIATVHCSAQTTSRHLLQKLSQTCLVISTNTGRVYRPKDCERLVLYLKDINLPKPDKWGTSTLVAFLQQVLTYQGFYDENLEWVGLENIQIVASMSAGGTLGRHKLTSRFTSIVRLCAIDYPERDQLQTIYTAYLEPVLHKNLKKHPAWGSLAKIHQLAGSMVQVYEQVRAKFTVDDYSHYLFTPCILTQWVLGLFRYDLTGGTSTHTVDTVLEIVAYEACRLFRDKIVGTKELHVFDNILMKVFQGDWGSDILDNMIDSFYVTWGAHHDLGTIMAPGQTLPPHGRPLGKLNSADLKDIIRKGIIHYGRDNHEIEILLFPEVLDYMSRVDRVLSFPGGSLLLAGHSGVGRRTVTSLVSHMHGAFLITPKISRGYEMKQFKNDLKHVMQLAGIEAQHIVLLLEDYQFVQSTFLEMINSLLSSGEVPGLYTTEELEPLLSPLKDQASQDGFTGPVFNYFTYRIQQNLHIVLIMDSTNLNFTINCESNPALHKKCQVLWMENWSESSMKKAKAEIPEMLFRESDEREKAGKTPKEPKRKNSDDSEFLKSFLMIHDSCKPYGATPRRYMTFLHMYRAIYNSKRTELIKRQNHLQAGVAKLNEAKALVDELNKKAEEQSILLKMKQDEADAALQEITASMQDASEQKSEMEKIKQKIAQEVVKIEERKAIIEDELKEVQPLVNEAKLAVGNIKPESLSEIRSLRMPPDIIRDILEGVLRLMGIFDTSWVSMKSFLAKRGVREDIATFDARNIPKEIRENVEELLAKNKASFDPKNAKRASIAAAPLAAWVKANVQYSYVLERIQPLETEQAGLEANLRKTEERKQKLEDLVNSVGQKVAELKDRFQARTSEAAKLEAEVAKAQETVKAAEILIKQLDREHKRWNTQVSEIADELSTLPRRAQLSAAFITYLSAAPEDQRKASLDSWTKSAGLEKFDLRRFLCTESEQLIWKSEGLPSDDLSIENALVILQSKVCPFLIDPSSRATEWLKTHLKESRLEIINQQDANFINALELAVRFGKTLIIQEMDGVEPVLYPLLRKDLVAQGPRYVVQIGDKIIDYNEEFCLFLSTRNPNPYIPPDAASIVTEVNFTITRSGLRGQLLALTIQHEKPDLEEQKTKLLQQEEDKKIQLAKLEESLLETLATSQGNILENKDLIESLNQTKASSALIQESLAEFHKLQISLDQMNIRYTGAEEAEVDRFYEGLQHLLELTPKNIVLITMGDWNAKAGSQKMTGITGKFGLGVQNEAGHKLVEFCQENTMVIANTLFQQPKRRVYTWTSPDSQHRNQIGYVLCSQRWRSSIPSVKTRPGDDCGSDHELLVAKFRLKLKKERKSTRPLRYDLNHIPDEYTVEVTNRFKELDLIECLKNYGRRSATLYKSEKALSIVLMKKYNPSQMDLFIIFQSQALLKDGNSILMLNPIYFQERDAYLPLAASASKMYFIISDLSKINNMYRFSLASFLRLFQRALQSELDLGNTEERIKSLISLLKHMVYEYVCRCLFKADQLMFALHFVKGMHPDLFQENEWDTFTGVIIGDLLRKSDSQKSIREQIPSWIEQERTWAVATLKISLPVLYQTLCLQDAPLWQTFSRSSMCEQDFPTIIANRISLFQQVLVVQAVRPDRLQSAMALFACKALGIKELSPPPLNLKRLYKETLEIEPILILISPGADPSQELQELASIERNGVCYHQAITRIFELLKVAMGQGQADLAIHTLKECARNGEWLCLKNLHLVVSWLPVLEKELNNLQPQSGFRLWLTAEVHPKFSPILLQSSLKITYEAPPGLKKNLMRTYESWTPEQISKKGNLSRARALFSLAWFHAACQERRNYIPQGWTKFYEFSLSDLRAGYDIIDRLFDGAKDVQWEFVHGLLENAIYGGRIDNYFDMRVLRSYLEQFFNSRVIADSNFRGKKMSRFPYSISLPNSCNILDYRHVIESLPEDDKPDFFGLPANIARSSQRMISSLCGYPLTPSDAAVIIYEAEKAHEELYFSRH